MTPVEGGVFLIIFVTLLAFAFVIDELLWRR